jgi:membrane-associated protease RseP (regulator of RpoE activity)
MASKTRAMLTSLLLLFATATLAEKAPVSIVIRASVEQIKANIVAATASNGFHVLSDNSYQLVLAKDITGFKGAMTQVLMGNEYSNTPVNQATFTFAPNGNTVLVNLTEDVIVQMPFGRVNKKNISNEKKTREDESNFLRALKLNVERANSYKTYIGVFTTSPDSVLLKEVVKKAPADVAGLKSGDMIVSIEGKPTTTFQAFAEELDKHSPGDVVKVTYLRDGKLADCAVTLAAPPAS